MSYITFSSLGASGHLGSQIQTYAGLLAIAKANGLKVAFSKAMVENSQSPIRVFDLLDLEYEEKPNSFFNNFISKNINYHTTPLDESLFNLNSNLNYNLIGRFDLYTYWYNSIGQEVANWNFKPDVELYAQTEMQKIKSQLGNKPTVSIHVRRGDYLLPYHAFCSLDSDYYIKAIVDNFMPVEDYNFIVFSNDIKYVKEIFVGNNIWFVEPKGNTTEFNDSEKEDLALLSLCDHHIIANSSYSWWGAYLSKNPTKKVICPTNYLKSNHSSSWINGNYYPPTWINIDNKC
jgi:hypothetical protein